MHCSSRGVSIDLVYLGELLVDMFPAEVGRGLAEVSAFRPVPGGAPANVAVAAAQSSPARGRPIR